MADKCEGCNKPATRTDSEGVPLCGKCYRGLVAETWRDIGDDVLNTIIKRGLVHADRQEPRVLVWHKDTQAIIGRAVRKALKDRRP